MTIDPSMLTLAHCQTFNFLDPVSLGVLHSGCECI